MLAHSAVFTCSICGEASLNICAYCTKDACANHQCARCKRCSDCCECEVPLSAEEPVLEEAVLDQGVPAETLVAMDPVVEEPAPEQVEMGPGGPMLSPAEAAVFRLEKREAVEIQEPDFESDPEETAE